MMYVRFVVAVSKYDAIALSSSFGASPSAAGSSALIWRSVCDVAMDTGSRGGDEGGVVPPPAHAASKAQLTGILLMARPNARVATKIYSKDDPVAVSIVFVDRSSRRRAIALSASR